MDSEHTSISPQAPGSSDTEFESKASVLKQEKNPTHINSILNPSRSSAQLPTLGSISKNSFSVVERADQSGNIEGKNSSPSDSNSPGDFNAVRREPHGIGEGDDNVNEGEDDDDEDDDDENNNDDRKESNRNGDRSRGHSTDDNYPSEESKKTSGTLPPRKRPKVSRACDECRRKKVRCNAVFDMNSNLIVNICTNCEKNNDPCMFTRVPLKRGPNKGYTKKSSSSSSVNSTTAFSKHAKRSSVDSPKTPQSPKFPSPPVAGETEMLRIDSNISLRSNSNSITPQFVTIPQQVGNPVQPPYSGQQVILPPLNSIPFSEKISDSTMNNTQQAIFWKVPTEMPNLPPNVNLHGRKGSVDSTHSSISSSSSISSVTKNSMMFGSGMNRNMKTSAHGVVENSDSEDEFLTANSSRLARPTFQVPFALQNRSPRVSFTSEKDQRSSVSSIISSNSITSPTAHVGSLKFEPSQPKLASQNNSNFRSAEYKDSLYLLLDHYYTNLYPQYPLLPNPEIMKMSIGSIIDNPDFFTVIELFNASLQSINVITSSTNSTSAQNSTSTLNEPSSIVSVKFRDVAKAFEIITSMYISKSSIYQSLPGKILFTSTLVLLNYAVVLSGYDYSLGFGIAFSYFKDWLIFKEGYESPCFANLIQLVVLDSLHTLYYGLPRSSTVCFAIDTAFINTFLKEVKFTPGVELEWLSVGLHLVVLNNKLQELDTLNKLDSIVITGTEYKFMSIIKLYYELFIYCNHLNDEVHNITSNYNANRNPDISLNDVFKPFIYNMEMNLSKICKKLTNLIDEQLDDIELTKPNSLVALVLVKCTHISINTQTFIRSIIHLNEVLDFSNANKSNFKYSTVQSGQNERSRRGSDVSIESFGSISNGSGSKLSTTSSVSEFSRVILDCNRRFSKLDESVGSNVNRSRNIKQTHQHSHDIINLLINAKKPEIIVPRTTLNSNKGGVDYSVVIQNWIRLTNIFFSGEITKEGINGWSCV